MQIFKIIITSWTASFRYPNLISGYQPTLPVPPLSTVIGLISAAKGENFIPKSEKIGFVFVYEGKAVDLETIYQIPYGKLKEIKSNVIRREFLFETKLFLYTDNLNIYKWFLRPKFQLLLGRSSDLATVIETKEIEIEEKTQLNRITGTIIPFEYGLIPGIVQALPKYFSDTLPRRNIGTKPYTVVDWQNGYVEVNAKGFYDIESECDVCWQEI